MTGKLFKSISIFSLCLIIICITSTAAVIGLSDIELSLPDLILVLAVPAAVIILGAFAISFFMAKGLIKRLLAPLYSIDLKKPAESSSCEELAPLIEQLELLHRETEEKKKELADKRLNMEFAEENRREFTANVSHELKTPLQSIMGSAELLENGLVQSGDIPKFAGNIRRESNRLLALIDDIIHLSRLDENSEMEFSDVDIYEICRGEVEAIRPIAEQLGVQLALMGEHITVTAVPQLVREIVHNLVDNAVKYNKRGGKVTVRVNDSVTKNILSVSDTGIGIPEEHRERIFERFYRVDKSHSKASGGTGLGLSIVKHAASYMNAEISLDSEVGVGTTVIIKFPK